MITERLELIPATVALCEAETQGSGAVSRALDVRVPVSWPPPVLERDDIERFCRQLEHNPASPAWTLHYLVRRGPVAGGPRELVGVAGFGGPPSAEGAVEVGYAIAVEQQGRGYATEAVRALVAGVLRHPEVEVVRATTYEALEPSIAVRRKAGFALVGRAPATGLLRFEHRRDSGGGPAQPAA